MALHWILGLFCVGHLSAQSTLTVNIAVEKDAGTLVLAICPTAEAYGKEQGCILQRVPVTDHQVVVSIDLPPGEYAIKAFQDLNGNGKLDTNWIGIPSEPYGFSNDVMGVMGPPSFSQAGFAHGPSGTSIRFRMKG